MSPLVRVVAVWAVVAGLVIPAPALAESRSDCCAFASNLATEIAEHQASLVPGAGARGEAYVKALGKAIQSLRAGSTEGGGGCQGRGARQKYQYARGWLVHADGILDDLEANDGSVTLFVALLDSLLAGVCEDGPALPLE